MGLLAIDLIKTLEELDPSLRKVFIKVLEKIDQTLDETVKRDDFINLYQSLERLSVTVEELAKADLQIKENLNILTQKINELTEAQKQTEERLNELAEAQRETERSIKELFEAQRQTEEKIKELVEAQKRTEEAQRQTEEKIRELVEAQKRTEEAQRQTEEKIRELVEAQKKLEEAQRQTEEKIRELVEAQKEIQKSIKELFEAQRQTEEKIRELVEAQKKLEEAQIKMQTELCRLTKEHTKTREQLGGLSNTVGYILENEAYKYLPKLLERDYQIKVIERLKRDFISYPNNKYDELNIFGKAKQNGKDLYLLGECKVQLGKKHIDEFLKKFERIKKVLSGDYFLIFVTHMPANPHVVPYARSKGIVVYRSDDFLEVGA